MTEKQVRKSSMLFQLVKNGQIHEDPAFFVFEKVSRFLEIGRLEIKEWEREASRRISA